MIHNSHPPFTRGIVPLRTHFVLFSILVILAVCQSAAAQLLQRSVAVQGARIVTMDGPAIENGTIVFTGSTIRAVGRDVKLPLLVRKIAVDGATITPGLIDVGSMLGRTGASARGAASPTRCAEDAFDRYATTGIRDAIHQGLTAVFVSPRGPAGICGTGAVIRLAALTDPATSYGSVLRSDAALCIDLASNQPAAARLKTLQAVRKMFQAAIQYQESIESYAEDLAKYAKQLADQTKKTEPDKEKSGPSLAKDGDTKIPTSSGTAPAKLQKPRRPTPSAASELLMRAMRREFPVRVIAHRSSDILNALELAREFSFDLILEGGTEAHLVAPEIAAAGVSVILGRMDLPGLRRNDVYRRAAEHPGKLLDDANVSWVVGSGAIAAQRTRFTLFNAQIALAYDTRRDPLRVLTADAAKLLGVEQKIGRLRPGMLADFVVWSGPPLDPTTKIQRVFVGGKQVYPRGQ